MKKTLLPRSKAEPTYLVREGPNKSKILTLNPFAPFDAFSHVLQYRIDDDTMMLVRAERKKRFSRK
jgi:hypothetical protein